jgi:hypothetical protein
MLISEVKIGGRYVARISGNLVIVSVVDSEKTDYRTLRNKTRFFCRNEKTGRDVVLSAAKLRREV